MSPIVTIIPKKIIIKIRIFKTKIKLEIWPYKKQIKRGWENVYSEEKILSKASSCSSTTSLATESNPIKGKALHTTSGTKKKGKENTRGKIRKIRPLSIQSNKSIANNEKFPDISDTTTEDHNNRNEKQF